MNRNQTSNQLYREVLRALYLGGFPSGSQFLTYVEFQEKYSVSKSTAARVYGQLRRDGFITTHRSGGTIVTYDPNNPFHAQKMPFFTPDPEKKEEATYMVPVLMLSALALQGLVCLGPKQLEECRRLTQAVLACIEKGEASWAEENRLFVYVLRGAGNQYLTKIGEHFLGQYLSYNRFGTIPDPLLEQLKPQSLQFYRGIVQAMEDGAFATIPGLIRQYYDILYGMPSLLLFSKLEEEIPQEKTMYTKLLHQLYVMIRTEALKPGDALPTTARLQKKYGVGEKTARRAYGVLAEIGFIVRKERVGTRLAEPPTEESKRRLANELAKSQKKSLEDASQAMLLLCWEICRPLFLEVTPQILADMEAELEEQRSSYERNGAPFMVIDVLITPMILSWRVGILQKYYFSLCDILIRFRASHFLQATQENAESEQVYQQMKLAVEQARRGDVTAFWEHAQRAIEQNQKLLYMAFERMADSL